MEECAVGCTVHAQRLGGSRATSGAMRDYASADRIFYG
jgi:hypothetical protein